MATRSPTRPHQFKRTVVPSCQVLAAEPSTESPQTIPMTMLRITHVLCMHMLRANCGAFLMHARVRIMCGQRADNADNVRTKCGQCGQSADKVRTKCGQCGQCADKVRTKCGQSADKVRTKWTNVQTLTKKKITESSHTAGLW